MRNLDVGMEVVQGLDASASLSTKQCIAMWQSGITMYAPSNNPTLIGLLPSDRIGIIHDPKLRAALLSYGSSAQRALIFIERVGATGVMVADKYPDAFPRRVDPHSDNLSTATCNLARIRTSQALQNNLLSNLGRMHGILGIAESELTWLKKLQAEVDAYHP